MVDEGAEKLEFMEEEPELAVDKALMLLGIMVDCTVEVTVETPVVMTTVVNPFALIVAVIGQMVV